MSRLPGAEEQGAPEQEQSRHRDDGEQLVLCWGQTATPHHPHAKSIVLPSHGDTGSCLSLLLHTHRTKTRD